MQLADWGPERRRGHGAASRRKEAGIVLNVATGNARAWRSPASMAGQPAAPPRPGAGAGAGASASEGLELQAFPEESSPILSLPPEALAHVLDMLDPLEVVAASGAHPDWPDVANRLVLVPRGHLAVRVAEDSEPPFFLSAESRLQPMVHTLHLVSGGSPNPGAVRSVLKSLATTLPLDAVRSVWLHEQGAYGDPVGPEAGRQHATLVAILELCGQVSAINFCNVRQCAAYIRLLVDAGPRPHFRSRFVFTESSHEAASVLVALEELAAFFEETVVSAWRPEVSVTAFYPHYWQPGPGLALPYPGDVHRLSVYGSGLEADAYRALADMTSLRDLRLYDADGLGDDALLAALGALAEQGRGLSRLAVHDAAGVSSAGWSSALASPALRGARSLELAGCVELDDDALQILRHHRLDAVTSLALDLEGCAKIGGAAVDALLAGCPNVESVTLVLAFSESAVDALQHAPARLARLRRLSVRVQGSAWAGDPRHAMAAVERLKRSLRAHCPASVQLDVSLTFIKLGMAVSCSPEDAE